MKKPSKTLKADQLNANIEEIISVLDARSQDIINRRYGIKDGKIETLDGIGKEYGITRERVRQIEAQAKKMLARRKELLETINEILTEAFEKSGGIATDRFLTHLISDYFDQTPHTNKIVFFLDILPKYEKVTTFKLLAPHWSHPEIRLKYVEEVAMKAESILKQNQKPIEENIFFAKIRHNTNTTSDQLTDNKIKAILDASNRLSQTIFGEWGLRGWVDTSPRGVGDKAYIILRRYNKPMHFDEITSKINEVKFDHKNAHRQTVHNELIKDNRFVLVGRGLYGLSDWGYIPGTVADVMTAILEKSNSPLSREELLEEVLKQRMVKKTTVLLGLQNNRKFTRVEGNKYALRK